MSYTSKQIAATINYIVDKVLPCEDNLTKNWFKAHLLYHINMQLPKNLNHIELGVGKKGFESFIEKLAVKQILFPNNMVFILKKTGESIEVCNQKTHIIHLPDLSTSKTYSCDDSILKSSVSKKFKC